MPNVADLLDDPEVGGGQPFVIVRRVAERVKGRSQNPTVEFIDATGTVQPADADTLVQLPEGDRSGEVLKIRTTKRVQTGKDLGSSDLLSDEIQYDGGQYKVLSVKNWGAHGMYVVICNRQNKTLTPRPVPVQEPSGGEGV
jgi:hypothetical protein